MRRNRKDNTEQRLWELGRRVNFNETISSVVFIMVLIASALFFSGAGVDFPRIWAAIRRKCSTTKEIYFTYFTGFGTSRKLYITVTICIILTSGIKRKEALQRRQIFNTASTKIK